MSRFAVDVKEDHVGVAGSHGALDVRIKNRIFDLAAKELDRLLAFTIESVSAVAEQVRKNLQKMRLTGSKEAGNPDSHLAARVGRPSLVNGFEIPRHEFAEMQIQFLRDDELVQLLPDRRSIELVCFHDAIDRSEDIALKEVLDKHYSLNLWDQLESSVVVVVL
jgi:hypothetical protein